MSLGLDGARKASERASQGGDELVPHLDGGVTLALGLEGLRRP